MKRCLVIGGNGFLGSHVAKALVARGYEVTVFDRFRHGSDGIDSIRQDIQIVKGDFLCDRDVDDALSGMDYVFHYISTTTPATAVENPIYDLESNVSSTVRLLARCVEHGVEKVIFPSSGGTIYGEPKQVPCKETDPAEPVNPYAISKLAIEKYLHYFYSRHQLDYLVLRYSNPYGEGQNPRKKQGVIPIFLDLVRDGEQPIIYGNGTAVRDYIYIGDAIDATLQALGQSSGHKIFNIGSGTGISVNDLVAVMARVTSRQIMPRYVPDNVGYISKIVLDTSRFEEASGWKPQVGLEEGIRRTWDWINRA